MLSVIRRKQCGYIYLLFAMILVAAAPQVARAGALPTEASGLPSLAPMLERVTPAVVNISVVSEERVPANPLYSDPFFRQFFDLPDVPQTRSRLSAGSGVIVDAEKGLILTNDHVIANATKIVVTLKDGRQLHAQLAGSDRATDIGLLRVKAKSLVALPTGDSDRLKVGDYVVAIGNPFGIGQTVTSGIVSALGRTGLSKNGHEDFIQTDASINPGNSGGALVTLDGKLVGINTAILSPAGGNVGICFAIPSNVAVHVIHQLADRETVYHGKIGVSIQDMTDDLAEALSVADADGAVVSNVEPASPAAEAGLEVGDVITAINGHPIHEATELRKAISLSAPGSEVKLRILRRAEQREIPVKVVPANASTAGSAASDDSWEASQEAGSEAALRLEQGA